TNSIPAATTEVTVSRSPASRPRCHFRNRCEPSIARVDAASPNAGIRPATRRGGCPSSPSTNTARESCVSSVCWDAASRVPPPGRTGPSPPRTTPETNSVSNANPPPTTPSLRIVTGNLTGAVIPAPITTNSNPAPSTSKPIAGEASLYRWTRRRTTTPVATPSIATTAPGTTRMLGRAAAATTAASNNTTPVGKAPGPPGSSPANPATETPTVSCGPATPYTNNRGCVTTAGIHGNNNPSGSNTRIAADATVRTRPAGHGHTNSPTSSTASTTRCTIGTNAPATARHNAVLTAALSHRRGARINTTRTPASSGGNNRCAMITPSLPWATPAAATGNSPYAAATAARSHWFTGSRAVAVYALIAATVMSPSNSSETSAAGPPSGTNGAPSTPRTASAGGALTTSPPVTGCQAAR